MADVDTTPEDTACPTDATLRSFSKGDLDTDSTEAIAAHLEHCLSCQGQLEQLDRSSAGVQSPVAEPASLAYAEESACGRAIEAVVQRRDRGGATATDRPPERLGEFRLLESLGAGGMGTVYKARHQRLGTTSAIKLLHVSQQADERMIERFQREMVALGRLDHPNIVRALDAGEDAGVHYLVMEYVEGADLGAIVQRTGPLSIADACEAARQAALGLAYVHEQGRVHRDVKPSNLMVSAEGQVKLLDLGLARVDEYALDEPTGTTDDLLGAAAELTRTHQVMGTLEYMPPEQAASSKTVTEKADLYALGCTLYKLLAGHPPFGSGQAVTAMSQLMAHVQRPAPPIGESRSDVPPGLARLLERMLAKRPEDRPASAAEVAAALARYSRGSRLAALAAPINAASGASTARELRNAKRISAQRGVAGGRRGFSQVQKWALAAGLVTMGLLLLAIPLGLIGWLYLPMASGTVVIEADSPEAEQLLQASGGLFFVPQPDSLEQSSLEMRIPVRPGMQELRSGKYVLEQAPPLGSVSPQGPQAVFAPAEFDLGRDQQVVVSLGVAEAPPAEVAQDAQPSEPELPPATGPAVLAAAPEEVPLFQDAVKCLAISPDGKLLAAASEGTQLLLWDLQKKETLHRLAGHTAPVQAVRFSPDGKWLISGSSDRTVRIWETDNGKLLRTFPVVGNVSDLEWSPEGAFIAVVFRQSTVAQLFDSVTGKEIGRLELPSAHALKDTITSSRVTFSPDGSLLLASCGGRAWPAFSGGDATISLWETTDWSMRARFFADRFVTYELDVSPDGRWLAAATNRGKTVKLWKIPPLKPEAEVDPAELAGLIQQLDSDKLSERAAAQRKLEKAGSTAQASLEKAAQSGSREMNTRVQTILNKIMHNDLRPTHILTGSVFDVHSVTFSPDGKLLASGRQTNQPGNVILWKLEEEPQRIVAPHQHGAWRVAFTPDGKQLITGRSDGHITIWNSGLSE